MRVALIGATRLRPKRLFVELSRRGHFRLGKDQLLTNDKDSSIS
jgi:putative NADH-flavin reductase